MKEEEIIHEIYWSFRDLVHNGHKELPDADEDVMCVTCSKLAMLEGLVRALVGDDRYDKLSEVKGGAE